MGSLRESWTEDRRTRLELQCHLYEYVTVGKPPAICELHLASYTMQPSAVPVLVCESKECRLL